MFLTSIDSSFDADHDIRYVIHHGHHNLNIACFYKTSENTPVGGSHRAYRWICWGHFSYNGDHPYIPFMKP